MNYEFFGIKYMKLVLYNIPKLSPEMPPECVYGLHFVKFFRGGMPPYPPRNASCLRHSQTRDPRRRFLPQKVKLPEGFELCAPLV